MSRLRSKFPAAAGALLVALAACSSSANPTPSPERVMRASQVSGTASLLIAVSAIDDTTAWAVGARGTWRRTIDGGETWRGGAVPGADSLQFRDVQAFDANTAWVLSIGNGPQSRIYRTDDAGASWVLQFRNDDPRRFYDCFSFWDARRGLVIGDAVEGSMDLLSTNDGGATWSRLPAERLPRAQEGEGSFAASGTCLTTAPGGRAWAVMSTARLARLIRTTDYGRTWAVETLPITTHEGSGPQSVVFRDGLNGMVLGGGYGTKPGDTLVAVTDDGGDTWIPRAAPAFTVGSWAGALVPRTRSATVVAAGPNGSAYSRDWGRSWVPIDTLNYWSVGGTSGRAMWAVGTQGRITRLSGW